MLLRIMGIQHLYTKKKKKEQREYWWYLEFPETGGGAEDLLIKTSSQCWTGCLGAGPAYLM